MDGITALGKSQSKALTMLCPHKYGKQGHFPPETSKQGSHTARHTTAVMHDVNQKH